MSAERLSVSLIVLSVLLPVELAKVDNCDSLTTNAGYIDCVSFPSKYKGSQWAVCASQRDISRNNKYRCHGSFCWLPCMRITTGKKTGIVLQKCTCNSSDWKFRPIQPLDLNCYLPGSYDCTWFTNCLSKYKDCPELGNTVADPFAQYLCSVFDSYSEHLSVSGNRYIRSLRDCLQREMFHLIFPSSNQTCPERKDIAQKAHGHCFNLHLLTQAFSDLPVNDQSYIFWTLKSVVINTFGSFGRDMLDKLRNCYQGNVQSVEKQVQITIDARKSEDVQSTVNGFAQMLKWPSNDIVWDGQILPQISTSIKSVNILFKPKVDFDFTIDRQTRSAVNINQEYRTCLTGLSGFNLTERNILEVSFKKENMEYFSGIGECPFHSGGKVFNNLYPEPLDKINVQFVLYSKQKNSVSKEPIDYFNDDTITSSSYDNRKRTYFIIHGFTNDGEEDWIQNMVSAFLEQEDCNVVVVDWEKGADIRGDRVIFSVIGSILTQTYFTGASLAVSSITYDYLQAVVNTRLVGCFVGKVIEKLNVLMHTSYIYFHLVGHSLGAHVSGFAGLYTQGKIGRISGLDPAGPAFSNLSTYFRLDPSDAIFVDIIHTDADYCGIAQPIGDIDFYPNGGSDQPGCRTLLCDHGRAHALFTESIFSKCNFTACLCLAEEFNAGDCYTGKTCTRMGFHVDQNKTGSFFLKTNEASLFCIE